MSVDKKTIHYDKGMREFDKKELIDYYYENVRQEDFICSQFGCGKKLTEREKLFGNKCINHSAGEHI